ncbi:MAG TPA: NAD-dependent epimerase/dehydratase family protein [Thermoleophilaceae bacterium]|nr:NAD-dependent epimerase/dehydratase family protein [Thermoleophilaceae bacterium]
MRVVVTGAAGFIGSHVCEELVGRGHAVVGIDGFTRFYARELKERNLAELRRAPGFSLREGNLLDRSRWADVLAGADAVCHLAGRPGVRGGAPVLFEAGNVRTTEAVMHGAARAGVRRVLLASSSSIYGPAERPVREDDPLRPLSPYARSKRRGELVANRLARRHGVELVTLRYFTVYGPRQRPDMAFTRFVQAALNGGEMPLLGDGRQVRDFTYVGDAAEATAVALERGRPGGVYNVAGGRPVALADALEMLGAALGDAPKLAERPPDAREPRSTAADLGRARRELGWTPRTPLEAGLRRQVEHAAGAAAA